MIVSIISLLLLQKFICASRFLKKNNNNNNLVREIELVSNLQPKEIINEIIDYMMESPITAKLGRQDWFGEFVLEFNYGMSINEAQVALLRWKLELKKKHSETHARIIRDSIEIFGSKNSESLILSMMMNLNDSLSPEAFLDGWLDERDRIKNILKQHFVNGKILPSNLLLKLDPYLYALRDLEFFSKCVFHGTGHRKKIQLATMDQFKKEWKIQELNLISKYLNQCYLWNWTVNIENLILNFHNHFVEISEKVTCSIIVLLAKSNVIDVFDCLKNVKIDPRNLNYMKSILEKSTLKKSSAIRKRAFQIFDALVKNNSFY